MIKISENLIDQIRKHGENTYNEECCGAIIGETNNGYKIIHELFEFNNEKDENRARRYLISPEQYKLAEKQADERKLELLGFYHSHPDHPAKPSQFDTDHALPWFLYMIVSVQNGQAKDLTAWLLKEDHSGFDEQKIIVERKNDER